MPNPLISLEVLGEALVGASCSLAFLLVCSFSLGGIVFGPIHEATRYPTSSTRYNIADIVVLLVQMQIVAAVAFALASASNLEATAKLTLGILVFVSLGTWWLAGVRMLTRARISSAQLRCWFLGIVVPVGFAVAGLAMWLPFALLISITILFLACTWGQWELLRTLVPLVSIAAAHVAGILICRLAS